MWRCKGNELLFNILPIKLWQDRLIRRHVLNCPHCGSRLADPDEARSVLALEQDFDHFKDIWPGILEDIPSRPPSSSIVPQKRKWLIPVAGLAAAGLAAVLILSPFSNLRRNPGGPDNVQVRYVRIEDQPAKTFIYQSKDSDRIYIWAEKSGPGAGS